MVVMGLVFWDWGLEFGFCGCGLFLIGPVVWGLLDFWVGALYINIKE